jgi:hypothetical protein
VVGAGGPSSIGGLPPETVKKSVEKSSQNPCFVRFDGISLEQEFELMAAGGGD